MGVIKLAKLRIKNMTNKLRNVTFNSRKENVKHIFDSCNSNIETLRKKIGHIRVNVLFRFLKDHPKFGKIMQNLGTKTVNELLDLNRELFLDFYRELYK